jgi:hypothetical protein
LGELKLRAGLKFGKPVLISPRKTPPYKHSRSMGKYVWVIDFVIYV